MTAIFWNVSQIKANYQFATAHEEGGAYGSAEEMVNGFLLSTTASSPRWRAVSAVTANLPTLLPTRSLTRICNRQVSLQTRNSKYSISHSPISIHSHKHICTASYVVSKSRTDQSFSLTSKVCLKRSHLVFAHNSP